MENATANTEFEQEQLKKLETLRKLTCAIVLRHVFAIVLVFCVCLAAILFFAWRRTMKSPQRFQTTTKLLFQPKETTQFAAMGIPRTRSFNCPDRGASQSVRLRVPSTAHARVLSFD